MKQNETFSQELVDFISRHEDDELADRIFDAAVRASLDEDGKGCPKKVFVALAKATAMFLAMCSRKTHGDGKVKAVELLKTYADVVDFYCFAADCETDEEGEP